MKEQHLQLLLYHEQVPKFSKMSFLTCKWRKYPYTKVKCFSKSNCHITWTRYDLACLTNSSGKTNSIGLVSLNSSDINCHPKCIPEHIPIRVCLETERMEHKLQTPECKSINSCILIDKQRFTIASHFQSPGYSELPQPKNHPGLSKPLSLQLSQHPFL